MELYDKLGFQFTNELHHVSNHKRKKKYNDCIRVLCSSEEIAIGRKEQNRISGKKADINVSVRLGM